mgnify:CR=1 FL=1
MKIKLLISMFTCILAGCSTGYLSTNFDRDNINHYFSAANVNIYKSEADIKSRYQFIDLVEGQDCQIKPHHAKPDEINARTQARQQAFDKKANGIIFSNCVLLDQVQLKQLNNSNDAKQCHSIVICYAKAYAVDVKPDNND